MKKVWVVDNEIPIQELYGGPFPDSLSSAMVRHLIDRNPNVWGEKEVLDLCRSLCSGDYELAFFLSPEGMLRTLHFGIRPPHAVIFDWEYPGYTNDRNLEALGELLESTCAYVQVYTHLGEAAIEPLLSDLRGRFGGRVLSTKAKSDVTPEQLAARIAESWSGTIAGELADKVREEVYGAVERSLVDMCEIRIGTIAAMAGGEAENLLHVVLSKVRDEIGTRGAETLDTIVGAQSDDASSAELQRLMSVWYYSFPSDDRVRRGDLIDIDGDVGLVITPPCDLAKLPKKTGRRLTWLKMVLVDKEGIEAIRKAGIVLNRAGNSIVAGHGDAGQTIIILPNVPLKKNDRTHIADYIVLCHAWESSLFSASPGGELKYEHLDGVERRCKLADPFASAVASRVVEVMSSSGTPDLPKGEINRLTALLALPPKPAVVSGSSQQSVG